MATGYEDRNAKVTVDGRNHIHIKASSTRRYGNDPVTRKIFSHARATKVAARPGRYVTKMIANGQAEYV